MHLTMNFLIHNFLYIVVDTQRENIPSNQTLTKSVNMRIWEIDTLNQVFMKGSYTEIEFSKKLSS